MNPRVREMRREAFVNAFLDCGIASKAALISGYSDEPSQAGARGSMLLHTQRIQEMLKKRLPQRNPAEMARVHGNIVELVSEAKSRYSGAREQLNEEGDDFAAREWFKLLLAATRLLADSAGATVRARGIGPEAQPVEARLISITQNVVIVDRKLEEARKLHDGSHGALGLLALSSESDGAR